MALQGQIVRLTCYAKKGDPGEEMQSVVLIENAGMEGDWHAGGGERQICLLPLEARQWMNTRKPQGICFRRFKENILFDKVPSAALTPGTRMRAGEAVLEISAADKHCFDGCPLYDRDGTCVLAGLNLFARVVKGGRLHPRDEIAVLETPGISRTSPIKDGEGAMGDKGFTHFDRRGNAVMVDVSAKDVTSRMAVAKGDITVSAETLGAIKNGSAKKGDVLGVARIAGIMAAKRTPELIPLCHPLPLDQCTLDFSIDEENLKVEAVCTVKLSAKTGAEMEALTGVSVALLTIYDMCKALDRAMIIGNIRLEEKSGGKSGHFVRDKTGAPGRH